MPVLTCVHKIDICPVRDVIHTIRLQIGRHGSRSALTTASHKTWKRPDTVSDTPNNFNRQQVAGRSLYPGHNWYPVDASLGKEHVIPLNASKFTARNRCVSGNQPVKLDEAQWNVLLCGKSLRSMQPYDVIHFQKMIQRRKVWIVAKLEICIKTWFR